MRKVRLAIILAMEIAVIALVAGANLTQGGEPASTPAAAAAPRPDRMEKAPPPTPADRLSDEGPGGPWARRGGMRVAPMFRDITDEDITQILAFVAENMPWQGPELTKMRQADPDRFRQVCRHLRFEIAQLRDLKTRDPEAFRKAIEEKQLKFRAQDLAAKARAATDPREREALREELRKVLDQTFDVETTTRAAQIRQLESRLEALRKELQMRAALRRDIIDKRLEELTPSTPKPASPAQ